MMANAAPWRQLLLDSLEANKHLVHAKYFQLATVKQSGAPAVRTVVFRGFEEGSNKLLITTDSRSRKVEELKALPLGEFVIYFSESWEQFRISGRLNIIGPDSPPEGQATRNRLWEGSSSKSLMQFVGPCPGLPVSKDEVQQPQLDKGGGPLGNFLIVALEPTEVDYLHLRQGKRLFFEKTRSSRWTEQAVNP